MNSFGRGAFSSALVLVAYIDATTFFPTERKRIYLEISSTAQVHSVLSFVTCRESDTNGQVPKLNLFSTPPEITPGTSCYS